MHTQSVRQLAAGFERFDDFAFGGEASGVTLGEDLLVVDADDEDAAAAADELRLDAELLPDLRRQTGGSGEVVSDAAVIDAYLHSWDVRTLECWDGPNRLTSQHPNHQSVFTNIAVTLSS